MKVLCLVLASAILASIPSAAQKNGDPCKVADHALSLGQLQEALNNYQICRQQSAPRSETLSNLGMLYARLGQFGEAIKTYQEALGLDPRNQQLNMNLGLAFLKSDRYEDAVRAFSRALLDEPGNAHAQELVAFCHFQLGQYELAAVEAERAHKLAPQENSTTFLLGFSYLKLRDYDKAIALIDQALRKADSAQTRVILGEAYLGVRAYRKALEEFSGALRLNPNVPGLHSKIGAAYFGLGNSDQAMTEFKSELAKNPNDFDANYKLARLERLSGDTESARKYLAKADQLRPGEASVQCDYAVFALQAREYAKAESLLRQVLEKYPSFTDAHVLLAEVYFKTRRREDGEREKAIVEGLRKAEQLQQSHFDEQKSQVEAGSASPPARQP